MIDKIDELWFKYNNEVIHKSTFVSNESIFKKLLCEFIENYINEDNERIINDLEDELSAIEDELIERNEIIVDLENDLRKLEIEYEKINNKLFDLEIKQ